MSKQPGVMLYFDRFRFVDRLSSAQNGQILAAVIHYGRDGVVPEFEDPVVAMAWDFVQPALDADAERYQAICEKRRKSAEKRWKKKHANESDCIPTTQAEATTALTPKPAPVTEAERNPNLKINPSQDQVPPEAEKNPLLALCEQRRKEWDAERTRQRALGRYP